MNVGNECIVNEVRKDLILCSVSVIHQALNEPSQRLVTCFAFVITLFHSLCCSYEENLVTSVCFDFSHWGVHYMPCVFTNRRLTVLIKEEIV